ncbi:MAG: RNA 2',3'-cyclic phosphodiesterase [bacterium]
MKAENTYRRVFFALWPDDSLRRDIGHMSPPIPPHSRAVAAVNLHLTLVFLGNIAQAQLNCVKATAKRIRFQPFSIQINRVGHFGHRILWIDPNEPPQQLLDLQNGLANALTNRCDYHQERRAYSPHITVARKGVPPLEQIISPALEWKVEHFSLIESTIGQVPPTYREIGRWCGVGG